MIKGEENDLSYAISNSSINRVTQGFISICWIYRCLIQINNLCNAEISFKLLQKWIWCFLARKGFIDSVSAFLLFATILLCFPFKRYYTLPHSFQYFHLHHVYRMHLLWACWIWILGFPGVCSELFPLYFIRFGHL